SNSNPTTTTSVSSKSPGEPTTTSPALDSSSSTPPATSTASHSSSNPSPPPTSTSSPHFPPILPSGPIAILGFGAGTAARLILHLYPESQIHGWELDPSVISVGREFFGLEKLEKQNKGKLFIYIGDALEAEINDGFSGILVDLFAKGSLIPELQQAETWKRLKSKLKKGGRIMVNCGGSCVEAEDPEREGNAVMVETLKAMREVFAEKVFVLKLRHWKEDSCVAFTGPSPNMGFWKQALPLGLNSYVDMWAPLS
ncbi:S-adenosyl-L-methionine-dependent methyltransferase protein, partial [Dioscorea alata]